MFKKLKFISALVLFLSFGHYFTMESKSKSQISINDNINNKVDIIYKLELCLNTEAQFRLIMINQKSTIVIRNETSINKKKLYNFSYNETQDSLVLEDNSLETIHKELENIIRNIIADHKISFTEKKEPSDKLNDQEKNNIIALVKKVLELK